MCQQYIRSNNNGLRADERPSDLFYTDGAGTIVIVCRYPTPDASCRKYLCVIH